MGIEEFLEQGDNIVMTFENGNEKCVKKDELINYIITKDLYFLEELDMLTYLGKYKGNRVKINIF